MKLISLGVCLVLLVNLCAGLENFRVQEVYNWKQVLYDNLPFDGSVNIAKYQYYIPENNDIVAFSHHAKSGLVLATVPRFRPGIPSSLNAFCTKDYPAGTSPRLWAFPDYKKNAIKAFYYGIPHDDAYNQTTIKLYSAGYFNNFFGSQYNAISSNQQFPYQGYYSPLEDINIVSVYASHIDNYCNRLFVLDTGVLRYSSNEVYDVQKPAIVVFDLPDNGCETRKFPVIRRVEIPDHLWTNPIGFAGLTFDYTQKSCDDLIIYVTNLFDYSLIAYDYKNGQFWSIKDPSLKPTIAESRLLFKDTYEYNIPLGVQSLTLGHSDESGNKIAYFAPVSSTSEFAVSTKVLRDARNYSYKYTPGHFTLVGYRGCKSQSIHQVYDEITGVIFFAEAQSGRIRCWNTQHPLNPDTVGTVYESHKIHSASSIDIDSDGYLWFHTSQLPFMYTTSNPLNLFEINSRTFKVKTTEAIKDTVCALNLVHGE
ncbi:hypothetical protein DMENIID0001_094650 [Sergentomyia squamirostris]